MGPEEGQETPQPSTGPAGPTVAKGDKHLARQPSRRRSMARAGVTALVSGVLRVITYKVGHECVPAGVLSLHMVYWCRKSPLDCIVHRRCGVHPCVAAVNPWLSQASRCEPCPSIALDC